MAEIREATHHRGVNGGGESMEDDSLRFPYIEEFVSELHFMRWKMSELNTLKRSNRSTIEKLRASEKKYRDMVSSLPVRIYAKDRNFTYTYCNEHYARDLNLGPSDIVGKKSHDFYPEETSVKFTADEESVLDTGKTEETEERCVVSGEELIFHSLKTPLVDEEGHITGILVVMTDVTEKRRMTDEIEKMHLRLQEMVEEKESIIVSMNHRLEEEIKVQKRYKEALRRVRMTFDEELGGEGTD